VFCKVSIVYTSILILLTSPLQTEQVATSITLLVIRVLLLMTLASSTAHMYLSKWFVPLVRTPSSQKLDSRLATASSRTHLLKEPLKAKALLLLTQTVTTEELLLRTSCDLNSQESTWESFGTPFFMSINS